jgi:hypothetical protein
MNMSNIVDDIGIHTVFECHRMSRMAVGRVSFFEVVVQQELLG